MGQPQQIGTTTDLEGANMASLSLTLSEDRMSIAQYHVHTLKSHTFRKSSYKDIQIQIYQVGADRRGREDRTRVNIKLNSCMCSDVARCACQEVCTRCWPSPGRVDAQG